MYHHRRVRVCVLAIIALVASGCASQRRSVRYNGRKVAEPVSDVKAYDAADAPCGHVEVGTVEVTCPGGCTFDEAIGMAKQRVAQAGVRVIDKVRATTTRDGRVASLQAVAVEVLGCVTHEAPPSWMSDPAAPH